MSKKTNPKMVPKTQADVDRAWNRGMDTGLEFALNVVLYVLKDKHNASDEDIFRLRNEFMYVVSAVCEKYLSYADIKRALNSEYDLTVELTMEG